MIYALRNLSDELRSVLCVYERMNEFTLSGQYRYEISVPTDFKSLNLIWGKWQFMTSATYDHIWKDSLTKNNWSEFRYLISSWQRCLTLFWCFLWRIWRAIKNRMPFIFIHLFVLLMLSVCTAYAISHRWCITSYRILFMYRTFYGPFIYIQNSAFRDMSSFVSLVRLIKTICGYF